MAWNDTVLHHPQLSSTDKLVYHLLDRLGDDSPQSRHQLSTLLGLGQRQLRRSRERLQSHGFLARSSMTAPAAPADIDDRRADISDRETVIHDRSFNAPTRTLWSSSSEEDVLEKPQYSPPPGGAGGESIPAEFLVEMRSVWKAIAPQEREAPGDWFRSLYRDFGPQIPLLVFHQFAQSQRTLQHLRHPPSYKSYFTRCCHRVHQEGANPSRQSRAVPEQPRALSAADYHLSDFFTPQPAHTWARAN